MRPSKVGRDEIAHAQRRGGFELLAAAASKPFPANPPEQHLHLGSVGADACLHHLAHMLQLVREDRNLMIRRQVAFHVDSQVLRLTAMKQGARHPVAQRRHGFDAHLTKPADPEVLEQMLLGQAAGANRTA